MKRLCFSLYFVLTALSFGESQNLFDGASLKAWQGDTAWWRVEGGVIVGEIPAGQSLKQNQFLFWEGELHDFDLTLKYRITGGPSANSGVQFRSKQTGKSAAGYQADLDDGKLWMGRIYDEHGRGLIVERGTKVLIDSAGKRTVEVFSKPESYQATVKTGDWNIYRIKAVGPKIEVYSNGKLTAELSDHQVGQQDFSGKLALQLHSGPGPAKIEFKDLVLIPLGKTPLPRVAVVAPQTRQGLSPEGSNLGFEAGSLKGWTATGDAWDDMPVKGDTVSPRRPGQASRHDGQFWVGGYERTETDNGRGTLRSDPFKVTQPWGSFLVGGGPHENTRVEIIEAHSGKVIQTASGTQVEDLRVVWVDLSKYQGKMIAVQVVDENSGHWGHVNYDDFRFHVKKEQTEAVAIVATTAVDETSPDTTRPNRVRTSPVLQHLVLNPTRKQANDTTVGMWVPEGFAVDFIASEPEVTQPIAFTFDARGRLWIAEAHSYPRRQPKGQGKDRIIILEDTDGDGSFETKKVFATGLNLVSGLEVGFGGVWVGAAPEFLFIPDANHDDQPDAEPVVLLDGWGHQDTHETLNSFVWGPDGWLYGNQGVFCTSKIGKPETPANERVLMRAGVWRYHPTKHLFDVFGTGCSNQWGIDFNENGEMFLTHCRSAWGKGSTTYMIRNGHYWNQSNSNHAPFIASGKSGWNYGKEEAFRNFMLAAARYGHGEGGAGAKGTRAIYGGHAHVGTLFYLGSNWPAQYRNQLFTHNLHGHQLNREIVQRSGSGFEVVNAGADHLYTPDPRFIGVDLKAGPDGAVYMIDWYDKQHCHSNNEEVWDRSDGRVYRMVWEASYQPVSVDLTQKTTAELVALVTSRDEWHSRMARRLLQERADPAAIPALKALLVQITPQRLRQLWTLHALGASTSPELLNDPDEVIRAWAVRLLSDGGGPIPTEDFIRLARTDHSARVQLALASALPTLADADRWTVVESLAARPEHADDFFLPKMIWYGIAPLALTDPDRSMQLATKTQMSMLRDSITWYLGKQAVGRTALVKRLGDASAAEATRSLELMAYALDGAKKLAPPEGWGTVATKLRTPANEALLDRLGGIFGDEALMARMRVLLVDRSALLEKRKDALKLIKDRADTPVKTYLSILEDTDLRAEVLPLLGRFDDPSVGAAILKQFPALTGADRNTALSVLTAKPKLAVSLLDAIDAKRLEGNELTALHLRSMQTLGNEGINQRITQRWGKVNASPAHAPAAIAKYHKRFTASADSLDAKAGEAVFTRLCAACHTMNGKGANLGPDLTGSWSSGLDYFLENIIDPNAVVGENYQLNIVTKTDNSVVSGMPEKETAESLWIRTVTETVQVAKADIKTRQVLSQSMMPPGLLDALPQAEALALLKFLTTE